MKTMSRGRSAAHRARQSVALTLVVLGLVAGAFAVPALAADDVTGAAQAVSVDPLPGDTPVDPGDGGGAGGGGGGGGGALDDPCTLIDLGVDKEPGIEGCQPLPCDNPNATNCPDTVEPCLSGVDYNGPDEDGCGTAPDNGGGGGGTDPGTVEPCIGSVDYNGADQDGCGTAPDNGGGTPGGGDGGTTPGGGGGTTPGGGGSTPGGGGGTTPGGGGSGGGSGGGTGGGSGGGNPSTGAPVDGGLGTTVATPEGSVPGGEAAAPVSECSDSVICQSAPTATASSSADGLPDTGAPADSQALLLLGFGLLAAGAFVARPRRSGGRHRLVHA